MPPLCSLPGLVQRVWAVGSGGQWATREQPSSAVGLNKWRNAAQALLQAGEAGDGGAGVWHGLQWGGRSALVLHRAWARAASKEAPTGEEQHLV